MENKMKIFISLIIILLINFTLALHIVEEDYTPNEFSGGLFELMSGEYGATGMIIGWTISIIIIIILITLIIWIFRKMKK